MRNIYKCFPNRTGDLTSTLPPVDFWRCHDTFCTKLLTENLEIVSLRRIRQQDKYFIGIW